jgi:hypothetical protein
MSQKLQTELYDFMKQWVKKFEVELEALKKPSERAEFFDRVGRALTSATPDKIIDRFLDALTKEQIEQIKERPTQEDCTHAKGSMGRKTSLKFPIKDYNVRFFTYVDGHQDIKCLICAKTWLPNQEGWKEAVDMCGQSTNTPASSEVKLGWRKSTRRS